MNLVIRRVDSIGLSVWAERNRAQDYWTFSGERYATRFASRQEAEEALPDILASDTRLSAADLLIEPDELASANVKHLMERSAEKADGSSSQRPESK